MFNLNINKKLFINTVFNLILIVFGTALLAAGTAFFLFPFGLVSGGISGLAIIFEKLLAGALSKDALANLLTVLSFILGFISLGKSFALKTLISTLVYPPMLTLFSTIAERGIFDGYFDLTAYGYGGAEYLIASIAGGATIGAGCALSFIGGGSTGGTDVPALFISKHFTGIKSSKAIFITDSAIILLGAFVMRDLIITLLGILSAFVAAAVIEKLFIGGERAFIANIVSKEPEKIAKQIIENLGRTVSIIDITGGYSGEKKQMLMVSFSASEYSDVMDIINRSDKHSFITVHAAHEIGGNGWTR